MSTFFPQVNTNALKEFAAVIAAAEHPTRATGRRVPQKPSPVVANIEDVKWAGEKVSSSFHNQVSRSHPGEQMIQITFERASLPLGPHTMMAYFPRGRKMLTTQAVVRHTRVSIGTRTYSAP